MTTRKDVEEASEGGGGWGGGAEFGDAGDHVAYGFDGAECVVGDFDVEGLFDLEGDVDFVEGVDVELVEGAGQRDGVGGDALRLGDDVNTAAGDLVHGGPASLWVKSTYSDACADVKAVPLRGGQLERQRQGQKQIPYADDN
jgi:hypothetical protein